MSDHKISKSYMEHWNELFSQIPELYIDYPESLETFYGSKETAVRDLHVKAWTTTVIEALAYTIIYGAGAQLSDGRILEERAISHPMISTPEEGQEFKDTARRLGRYLRDKLYPDDCPEDQISRFTLPESAFREAIRLGGEWERIIAADQDIGIVKAAQYAVETDLRKGDDLIASTHGALSIPSDPVYRSALSPQSNHAAYIYVKPADETEDEKALRDQVELSVRGRGDKPAKIDDGLFDLIALIYSLIYFNKSLQEGERIVLQEKQVEEYLGKRIYSEARSSTRQTGKDKGKTVSTVRSFRDDIIALAGLMGRDEKSMIEVPVVRLTYYDLISRTVVFEAPYLQAIHRTIVRRNKDAGYDKYKKITYDRPGHSLLPLATLLNERDEKAIEIVQGLCQWINGERQDPKRKEKEVSRSITFAKFLSEYCPRTAQELDAIKTARDRSKVFKRHFTNAIEYLPRRTKIFQYYTDFQLFISIEDEKGRRSRNHAYTYQRDTNGDIIATPRKNMSDGRGETQQYNPILPRYGQIDKVELCFAHKGAPTDRLQWRTAPDDPSDIDQIEIRDDLPEE